ncbi:unnamed protein product [Pylaiella littoralis]
MSDAGGGSAASAPDAGGSPGTSTLAPGSSTQDAQQDNEVVVVPGSTSGGAPQESVNVKRPAPVFHVGGGSTTCRRLRRTLSRHSLCRPVSSRKAPARTPSCSALETTTCPSVL